MAEPLMTLRGDHFIVRDETAQRTLAGGIVIHPWARRHKRNEPDLEAGLELLHSGDLAQLTEAFLEQSPEFAVSIESIHQFLNLQEDDARQRIEKLYTTDNKWQGIKARVLKALKDFHAAHPLVAGMEMEELRGKLPYGLPPKIFRVMIDLLVSEKAAAKEGNFLRLPTHRIQLGGAEQSLMEKIKKILGE